MRCSPLFPLIFSINAMWLIMMMMVMTTTLADEVDIDLNVDKTGWIDPNDPLSQPFPNYANRVDVQCDCEDIQRRLFEENMNLRQQLEASQSVRENSVDVLMKHVLRQFLDKLNIDIFGTKSQQPIFKKAQVSLSLNDFSVLQRYLSSEKTVEEFGLREDLRTALENFLTEVDVRSSNSMLSLLHQLLPYIMVLNILILMPATFLVIRSTLSIRRVCFTMLTIAFGLSCYFTYIRKYQEVLALRFERTERAGRDGKHPCSPQGLVSEAFDLMLSYVTIKDKSECLKSYEDMLIEPFLLVDPLQVLAEVLSNFFLAPLSVAGIHLNSFFKHFFVNVPLPLALLMTIFIFLMPIVILWAVLKIREHLRRERRMEKYELSQNNTNNGRQLVVDGGGRVCEIEERERRVRRRALGQSREELRSSTTTTSPRTPRQPSIHLSTTDADSSADESSSVSVKQIRRRMEERRKWEG